MHLKDYTAGRLREIGMKDSEIRGLTYGEADDILNFWEPEEDEPPMKKYTCRYCGGEFYQSEVIAADNTIICRRCAYGS